MTKFYRNRFTIGDIPQLDVVVPSFHKIGSLFAKMFMTGVSTTPTNKTAWDNLFKITPNDTREWVLPSNGVFWKSTDTSTPTGANNPPTPITGSGATGLAYELDGYLYCPVSGVYSFHMNSDDGGEITIDDSICYFYYGGRGCATDYASSMSRPTEAGTATPITLSEGWHKLNLRMHNGGGGYGEAVGWKKPGDANYSTIPASSYGILSS